MERPLLRHTPDLSSPLGAPLVSEARSSLLLDQMLPLLLPHPGATLPEPVGPSQPRPDPDTKSLGGNISSCHEPRGQRDLPTTLVSG